MAKQNTDRPQPVTVKVNADNYATLAKPFIKACASRMISRLPQHGTRRQWGAWLSYFLRHHIPARLMSDPRIGFHDQSGDEYMVPTEWPHMFDASETVQGNHLAGDAFVALTKPGKRTVILVPHPQAGFTARRPA